MNIYVPQGCVLCGIFAGQPPRAIPKVRRRKSRNINILLCLLFT